MTILHVFFYFIYLKLVLKFKKIPMIFFYPSKLRQNCNLLEYYLQSKEILINSLYFNLNIPKGSNEVIKVCY